MRKSATRLINYMNEFLYLVSNEVGISEIKSQTLYLFNKAGILSLMFGHSSLNVQSIFSLVYLDTGVPR